VPTERISSAHSTRTGGSTFTSTTARTTRQRPQRRPRQDLPCSPQARAFTVRTGMSGVGAQQFVDQLVDQDHVELSSVDLLARPLLGVAERCPPARGPAWVAGGGEREVFGPHQPRQPLHTVRGRVDVAWRRQAELAGAGPTSASQRGSRGTAARRGTPRARVRRPPAGLVAESATARAAPRRPRSSAGGPTERRAAGLDRPFGILAPFDQ
jgi:hypothetical protein